MTRPFVLASASPRRLELLAQIGIVPDRVAPTDINESARDRELPRDVARRLACDKCAATAAIHPDSIVLGADTVVAIGRRVLGKAPDEAEARRMLAMLSGRRHRVYGGICVIAPGRPASVRVVCTAVTFKRLSRREIDDYMALGEWRDKAGAYAIQGRAGGFVRQIGGSYFNVVGLSIYDAETMLRGMGYQL